MAGGALETLLVLKGFAATPQLTLLGRLDGAIHSGGVTVFPEQLEVRLMAAAREVGLPLKAVLLLGVHDPEWGERLVVLVRWQDAGSSVWRRQSVAAAAQGVDETMVACRAPSTLASAVQILRQQALVSGSAHAGGPGWRT